MERHANDVIQICLFLNECSDSSLAVAEAYRNRSVHRVHIADAAAASGNVGFARHTAMMMGVAATSTANGLLLTTDADSAPRTDWLVSMTAALRKADVVTGRIVRTGEYPSNLQDRLENYYDALFELRRRLDPVPWEAIDTHHYAGGANIGVRAQTYLAIGGFSALTCGEDALLIDDAARAGFRVRRDASCVVYTSDRREGRAGGGLALALRQLDQANAAAIDVAHPHDAAWQYRLHAVARATYGAGRFDLIASELGLSPDHVLGVARDCPNGEAFAMRVVPAPPRGMRSVSLPTAEAALAGLASIRQAA